MIMLYFHPALQAATTLLGLFVAYLGLQRFVAQHMGRKLPFQWARHVSLGRIVLILWAAGLVGGLTVARLKWQVNFVTGLHYQTALAMVPLMLFGGVTGWYMDKHRARRTLLPLAHGVCNLVLLALALFQFRTGWQVIKDFIL